MKKTLLSLALAMTLPAAMLAENMALQKTAVGDNTTSYRCIVPYEVVGKTPFVGNGANPDEDFSLAMWFNETSAISGGGYLLGHGTANHNNTNSHWWVNIDTTGNLTMRFAGGDNQAGEIEGIGGLSLGSASTYEWHYIVVAVDNSNRELRVFVDGEQRANHPLNVPLTNLWTDAQFRIFGHGVAGEIDQVEFYSTALTAAEAVAAQIDPTTISSTRAVYTFDNQFAAGTFDNAYGPATEQMIYESTRHGAGWSSNNGPADVTRTTIEATLVASTRGEATIDPVYPPTPPAATTYTVTINPCEGGTLQVLNGEETVETGAEIEENTTLTLVATPAEGYQLQAITVDGLELEGTTSWVVRANVTFGALFTEIPNSITEISADAADAAVYDLQGRRVARVTRGIYVVNGVKVIVR